MSISIGADYYLNNALTSQSATKADKLSSSLGAMDVASATDAELLESCKEFEAYLVEQMLKGMEKRFRRMRTSKKTLIWSSLGMFFIHRLRVRL
ncbi:MAG: hypothetical protein K2O03_12700 [Lachnospiraceae bacterium]|nr:hypothetical protein [Lachnospiraceae bacterium]